MARLLEENHLNSLEKGFGEQATLLITLGDRSILRLATARLTIGEETYFGLLNETDALTMELTQASDAQNFEFTNLALENGQVLMNTPNILQGCVAMRGVWYRNLNGEEFHDETMPGTIQIGEIDGNFVPLVFVSLIDSYVYAGKNISSVFPNQETAVNNQPPTELGGGGGGLDDNRNPLLDRNSRYTMPDFETDFNRLPLNL